MKTLELGNVVVGKDKPLYFIADIAANHDGDINRAYKLIELAHEAGADAAKFQNFTASKIVSDKGFKELKGQTSHQSQWGKSAFEVYEDATVSYDWTKHLKDKCNEIGIEYFTSPYDFQSVDHVDPYVEFYKIGSGDITWLEIIEYISKKGKPVLIATGASSMNDVNRAMDVLMSNTAKIVLMQCNTNYTASEDNYKYINLNVLKSYAKVYPQVMLGLSDHTPGRSTVLGAIALGAQVIEKHFTDDNTREGPDHKFAMNPQSWREMVNCANELYYSLGDGIKRVENNEKETVVLQRRALRYAKAVKAGSILPRDDVIAVRPIPPGGIPPYEIDKVLGQRINRDVKIDTMIEWRDIKNDTR